MSAVKFNGVFGRPDVVLVAWAHGKIEEYNDYGGPVPVHVLKKGNDNARANKAPSAVIPYRIRVYMHPNKPKRGNHERHLHKGY